LSPELVSYPERGGSSLADPHRIGPFGGWHFGSMAGRTLRGVAPSPETLRSRAPSNGGKRGWAGWANGDWRSGCLRTRAFTCPATRSAARSRTATPPRKRRSRQKRGKEGGRCGGSVGEGSSCLSRACSLGTEGVRAARQNPSREEILEKVALERERELAGCPAKILSSGRRADPQTSFGKPGFDEVDETWGSVLAG